MTGRAGYAALLACALCSCGARNDRAVVSARPLQTRSAPPSTPTKAARCRSRCARPPACRRRHRPRRHPAARQDDQPVRNAAARLRRPRSYVMQISDATVSMDMASLQNLMNRFALRLRRSAAQERSRHERRRTAQDEGHAPQGRGRAVLDQGDTRATPDGRHAAARRLDEGSRHPGEGTAGLFGLEARRSRETEEQARSRGPGKRHRHRSGQILPPPEMRGRIVRIELRGDRLSQMFGDQAASPRPGSKLPDPSQRNYIYFGGGDIRFGKLTMHDADLQLIDSDPEDPFEFSPTEVQHATRRRLLEEHAVQGFEDVHAGHRRRRTETVNAYDISEPAISTRLTRPAGGCRAVRLRPARPAASEASVVVRPSSLPGARHSSN